MQTCTGVFQLRGVIQYNKFTTGNLTAVWGWYWLYSTQTLIDHNDVIPMSQRPCHQQKNHFGIIDNLSKGSDGMSSWFLHCCSSSNSLILQITIQQKVKWKLPLLYNIFKLIQNYVFLDSSQWSQRFISIKSWFCFTILEFPIWHLIV